jgi:hypothetical protein
LGYLLVGLSDKKRLLKYSVFGIIFFFIVLNLFQTWQTANGILFSSRASRTFWLASFGRTNPVADAEKLLYRNWPTSDAEYHIGNENEYIKTHTWSRGFEESDGSPKEILSSEIVHSGNTSCVLDSVAIFSPAVEKRYSEITEKYYAWIRISVWVYPTSEVKQNPANLIATFMHNGKAYNYRGLGTDKLNLEVSKWSKITFDYLTPEVIRNEKDYLSIYIWNNGKGKIYVDDLQVDILEPKIDPAVF